MKTCPYCAEEIQDAAIVCKHCRRDLPIAGAAPVLSPYEQALASVPPVATVASPAPPAPATKGKRRIGCLAIAGIALATILAIGVIGSIVAPLPTTSTTSTTSSRGTLIVGDKAVPTPPPAPKPYEDLEASVRFNGTQFTVTNSGTQVWTDVRCELNSGLLSGGYEYRVRRLGGGEHVTVGAMQFAKSDGTRFDPFQTKPQKLTIRADINGRPGFYYGTWE